MNNYVVEYYFKHYDDLCFRCFSSLDKAIRFTKYNDEIVDFKIYRIYKNLVDLSNY